MKHGTWMIFVLTGVLVSVVGVVLTVSGQAMGPGVAWGGTALTILAGAATLAQAAFGPLSSDGSDL